MDLYGSLSGQFSICVWTYFDIFRTYCERNAKVKKTLVDEHQSCCPFNSGQDAPSIKFCGFFVDGFVDISIFMIWGSLGIFGTILARLADLA